MCTCYLEEVFLPLVLKTHLREEISLGKGESDRIGPRQGHHEVSEQTVTMPVKEASGCEGWPTASLVESWKNFHPFQGSA